MIPRFESEEAALEAAALEAAAVEAEEALVDAEAELWAELAERIPTEELPEEDLLGAHHFTDGGAPRRTSSVRIPGRRTSSVRIGEAWRYAENLGFPHPSAKLVAVCARRIEHERGEAQLPHVPAKDLPAGTPETVVRVWRGFLLLTACWRMAYRDAPVMFTRSFAARWCGVSEDVADRAIRRLHSGGLLRRVSPKGRPGIWLPAPPNEDGQA